MSSAAPIDSEVRDRIVQRRRAIRCSSSRCSMLVDDGVLVAEDGVWVARGDLPRWSAAQHRAPSARLDRLGAEERRCRSGPVIGEEFGADRLEAMVEDGLRPATTRTLGSLAGKQLIAPIAGAGPDEGGYRFLHVLIRDAAYQGILKRRRADLDERAQAEGGIAGIRVADQAISAT
jgi:predicted ATPase